jgi:hypothetical protein
LTLRDNFAASGVSAAFVYQHANGTRRPSIPSVKLGGAVRFRPESIQRFIEEMERVA